MSSRGNPLQAIRAVFRAELTTQEKITLLALLDHFPDCRPSLTRLSQWTSISRRRVIDQLQSLEERGIVTPERRRGMTNRYRLADGWERFLPCSGGDVASPAHDVELVTERHPTGDVASPHQGRGVTSTGDVASPKATKEATKGSKQGKRSGTSSSKRWTRVPDSWTPTEGHQELATELGVNLQAELPKFRDHEFGKPKSDADACFRTWLRNAKEFARGPRNARPRQPNHGGAVMPMVRSI